MENAGSAPDLEVFSPSCDSPFSPVWGSVEGVFGRLVRCWPPDSAPCRRWPSVPRAWGAKKKVHLAGSRLLIREGTSQDAGNSACTHGWQSQLSQDLLFARDRVSQKRV